MKIRTKIASALAATAMLGTGLTIAAVVSAAPAVAASPTLIKIYDGTPGDLPQGPATLPPGPTPFDLPKGIVIKNAAGVTTSILEEVTTLPSPMGDGCRKDCAEWSYNTSPFGVQLNEFYWAKPNSQPVLVSSPLYSSGYTSNTWALVKGTEATYTPLCLTWSSDGINAIKLDLATHTWSQVETAGKGPGCP
jgi:hypothetical protein